MERNRIEAAYARKRIDTSLEMALAATCDCARMAHQALAGLYDARLQMLNRAMAVGTRRRVAGPKRPKRISPAGSAFTGTLTLRSSAVA
jgi:hypothetical protein